MNPVHQLLNERDHVLVGFDGLLCAVFGGRLGAGEAADRLKVLVGPHIPPDIAGSGDPFDVLRYAASCGPATAKVVDTQLRRLELEAIATADETPGIGTALAELHGSGFTITVVGNNSTEAIRSFLLVHDLAPLVRGISARTRPDPELLMPNPLFVQEAVRSLGTSPEFCLMVGASLTDIDTAKAVGVAVVGYATTSDTADVVRARGADAVIDDLTELRQQSPLRMPPGLVRG